MWYCDCFGSNGRDNCFNRNVARKLYESKIETRININLTNLEFNSEIVINFLLQKAISQRLAGRISYLYLLPFTLTELSAGRDTDVAGRIIKGSYPPVYDQKIDPGKWYPNYIRTYVERDVRQIKNISELS